MRLSLIGACLVVGAIVTSVKADNLASAVDDAARSYRIQVYENFRSNRAEYDQRRAIGDGLLGHWEQAGRPEAWSEELILWFQQASSASLNAQSELPPLPNLLPVNGQEAVPEAQLVVPAEPAATTTGDATPVLPPEPSPSEQAAPIAPAETSTAPASSTSNEATTDGALKAIGNALWRTMTE